MPPKVHFSMCSVSAVFSPLVLSPPTCRVEFQEQHLRAFAHAATAAAMPQGTPPSTTTSGSQASAAQSGCEECRPIAIPVPARKPRRESPAAWRGLGFGAVMRFALGGDASTIDGDQGPRQNNLANSESGWHALKGRGWTRNQGRRALSGRATRPHNRGEGNQGFFQGLNLRM